MRRRPFFLTFLVPSILIAVIFLAALGNVLQYSFRAFIPGSLDVGGFTLENFSRLAKPIYFWVLVDTFVISLATAVFTLLLSYPVAYALVRTRSNGLRTLLVVLSITPLFTGEIVRTYAWMLVLGSDGFLNTMLRSWGLITRPIPLMYTELGVIIALVQFSMPVMIILLATAISHIDRDYEKAAANLGAAPAKVFWTVTLPLSMPGIVSGTVVIFAWTMSAFSTPQLIGGGKVLMISNLVYLQGLSSFNFPFAAVLSLIALLAAIGSLAAMRPFTLRLERKAALH
ncbi:MAG TPA: ABC transporter permease [Alphaproteobacteria bacterium]|nr:ABC transporter permease [Alphaproteobacteria bacterium]